VLDLYPWLTITAWKASSALAIYSAEFLARYEDGLRKAGLPEG
jgi:hypothetical protein